MLENVQHNSKTENFSSFNYGLLTVESESKGNLNRESVMQTVKLTRCGAPNGELRANIYPKTLLITFPVHLESE